jgi:inositol transport system substrate-binding protein
VGEIGHKAKPLGGRVMSILLTRRNVVTFTASLALGTAAKGRIVLAQGKSLVIATSLPSLSFPFFVHMQRQLQAEAKSLGDIRLIETDGQNSVPKQTADVEAAITQKVNAVVISPLEVNAMASALEQAVKAGIPVVTIDRQVRGVSGILAHVGADNVKGGEAQAEAIMKAFPNGAKIFHLQGQPGAGPAIDRNKGLHNVLDKAKDKYQIVFEQTANFARAEGLSVTEAGLAGKGKPDVIVCANDDMALGAMEAVKARNLSGIAIYGFDALPEALKAIRAGQMAATIEQFPGEQSREAMRIAVSYARDGKKPETQVKLLTPVAITKENVDKAERISEVS